MLEWTSQVLASPTLSLTVLAAAFLLGVVGSVTSCCNVAVLGALVGYSASLNKEGDQRNIILGGVFFMIGTIIALAALGAVTGFVSQTIGSSMGMYWKLIAGIVMVFFGLASLNLVPFKMPSFGFLVETMPSGGAGAIVYGLAIGGGTTACSAGCNPVLPLALGIATLQGHTAWGACILATFALGYSLPLAAGLIGFGLGFDKMSSRAQKLTPATRIAAGGLLIGVGFYLLATA